jgi:hypothetical protein
MRAFMSRNDDAQSSNVVSIDATAIHDPPNHGHPWIQKFNQSATVMLGLNLNYRVAATQGILVSGQERGAMWA